MTSGSQNKYVKLNEDEWMALQLKGSKTFSDSTKESGGIYVQFHNWSLIQPL